MVPRMATLTRPTVVCAWCNRMLVAGTPQVSHGICPRCVQTHMPDAWADLTREGVWPVASDSRPAIPLTRAW